MLNGQPLPQRSPKLHSSGTICVHSAARSHSGGVNSQRGEEAWPLTLDLSPRAIGSERGCVEDQPQRVGSRRCRELAACCGWSRTTQPRSGPISACPVLNAFHLVQRPLRPCTVSFPTFFAKKGRTPKGRQNPTNNSDVHKSHIPFHSGPLGFRGRARSLRYSEARPSGGSRFDSSLESNRD